jgi:site-specific recombinase XerD
MMTFVSASQARYALIRPSSIKSSNFSVAADLGIEVQAHMLRHAYGFKLANDGIDTRSPQQNSTRYAALASGRFKNFWRD